jgi:tetratricopeptide (TPR) repeat protein
LILDWYPFGRITSLRILCAVVIEKIPFFVLSAGSSVLTIYAQKAGAAMHLMGAVPLQARLLVAAKSLIAYLGKLFFPFNLIPFYPYPRDASFFSPSYFAAFLLIIGITVLCFSGAKRQKAWLALWGYYVATLIPVLGIVQVGSQSMADRYMYLPSCGPFLMTGIAVSWALARANSPATSLRRFTAASLAALLAFSSMSYTTVKQIGIWKNDLTLWDYVVRKERKGSTPSYHKDLIYLNLGAALLDNGQTDEAIENLRIALGMNPFRLQTYINMGLALGRKGRLDEAIEYFRYALAIMPTDAEAHNNLGWAYREKGMLDEAIAQFEIAVQLRPDYAGARSGLEEAYREKASRVGR